MDIVIGIAIFLISAVIFTFVGVYIRKKTAESKMQSAEIEARKIIDMAKKEAENKKKEEIFKAKEEIFQLRFQSLRPALSDSDIGRRTFIDSRFTECMDSNPRRHDAHIAQPSRSIGYSASESGCNDQWI